MAAAASSSGPSGAPAPAPRPKKPPTSKALAKLKRVANKVRRGSAMLKGVTAMMNLHSKVRTRSQAAAEDRKRRAQFSFSEGSGTRYVWLRDPKDEFAVAKIVENRPDGTVAVEMGASRESKIVPKEDVAFNIFRPSTLRTSFDDMVKMEDVNDATILHNLRLRFLEDQIYTNIGTILVSVNPFKHIDTLYTESAIQQHLAVGAGETAEPHIFGIAASAYRGVRGESQNQAVIISGESGAGKTEATKKCLQFLAAAAGSAKGDGVEKRLLAANPILEAFGNSKTVRNNNSSRFGKWMVVHFNLKGQICGSQIINYLLEKSRVTTQAASERNYHGFYQLCAAKHLVSKYSLGPAEGFDLLNKSGCITVPRMSDEEEFLDTCESLWQITKQNPPDDFESAPTFPPDFECILSLVACVLHLGNVEFEATNPDDPRSDCRLSSGAKTTSALHGAATLLQVEVSRLASALTVQERQSASERLRSPLELTLAEAARSSLAKALYGRMFDWLVKQVNESIAGDLESSQNIIGVLDIFGFEIFEHNTFEQLCINFCNEKLQQHFNTHVFKQEEKCYIAEGIDYSEVKFEDNQDVLDVIEKRPSGILILLDDQTKQKGSGSDAKFINRVNADLAKNPRFRMVRAGKAPKGCVMPFGIQHYAGPVIYDAEGFLEKNKDEMMLQLRELCTMHTSNDFIVQLFAREAEELGIAVPMTPTAGSGGDAAAAASAVASPTPVTPSSPSGRKRSSKDTQGSQFRKQLDSLMTVLNSTYPHYVRCVKSNEVKKPDIFDAGLCLRQLRYAGVFEAVKIRQSGFPFRWVHEAFYKRYRCCARDKRRFYANIPPDSDFKSLAVQLLSDLSVSDPESRTEELVAPIRSCKMGKTMVLYRAEPNRVLELMREVVRSRSGPILSRVWRGHRGRKRFKVVMAAKHALLAAMAGRELVHLTEAVAQAKAAPFHVFELQGAEKLRSRLQEEKDCSDGLEALTGKDPVEFFEEYKSALELAERLELKLPVVDDVKSRFATVRDRREAKETLEKGIRNGDRVLIESALAKINELSASWGQIVSEDTLAAASATMEVIKREDDVLEGIRAALSDPSGSLGEAKAAGAATGVFDYSTLQVASLEAALQSAQGARLSTKAGHDLLATGQLLIDLRQAFASGPNWPLVESVTARAVSLRDGDESIAREALPEVAQAEKEMNDRKFAELVEQAMLKGAAEGPIGALNTSKCDPDALTPIIDQGEAIGDGLSASNRGLLHVVVLMRRLRVALKAGDWSGVRRCIADAMKMMVPAVAVPELSAAKDEADDHAICTSLHDALSRGGPGGVIGDLDVAPIEVDLLNTRLQHAADLGTQTERAEALYAAGEAVLALRAAIAAGRRAHINEVLGRAEVAVGLKKPSPAAAATAGSPSPTTPDVGTFDTPRATVVGAISAAARATSPSEQGVAAFMPPAVSAEVELVRYDLENEEIVDSLRRSLHEGSAKGVVGALDTSTAQVKQLQAAVNRAYKLECRTGLAKWLVEVAEAVNDMRTALRASAWSRIQELVSAVRAMDGVSPTRFGASEASPGQRGRVLSMATRALPAGSMMAPDHLSQIGSMASQAAAAAARRSRARSGADGVAMRQRAGSGERSQGSSGREVFRLDEPVSAEIRLIQKEIDNRLILETIAAALARGQASGPIGELDTSRVEIDELDVAVARAGTLNPSTPEARLVLETGLRVLVLRNALLHQDWEGVDACLSGLAVTQAEADAKMQAAQAAMDAGAVTDIGKSTTPLPPAAAAAAAAAAASGAGASSGFGARVPSGAGGRALIVAVAPAAVDEVKRIRSEVNYRALLSLMLAAACSHSVSGVVGAVSVAGVSTNKLDDAIDVAGDLSEEMQTVVAQHLVSLCRLLWKLRRAVLDNRWDQVEALLEDGAADSVIGSARLPLPFGCSVPHGAMKEINLLHRESENRRAIRVLTAALNEGRPSGDIGHLDVARINTDALEDAMETAIRLGVPTAESRSLVATCVHVRACRFALMSHNWDKLEAYLLYAEAVRHRYGPGPIYPEAMARLAKPQQAPTDALSASSASASRLTESAQDAAKLKEEAAKAVNLAGELGDVIEEEEEEEEEEDEEEEEAEDDEKAAHAQVSGSVGTATTTTTASQAVIASRFPPVEEQEALPGSAATWSTIKDILDEVEGFVAMSILPKGPGGVAVVPFDLGVEGIAAEALPELRVCRSELNNRNAIFELTKAVTKGAVTGETGALVLDAIEVDIIDAAIDKATELGLNTLEVREMCVTAGIVRSVRAAVKSTDWEALERALHSAQGRSIASIVQDEIRAAQDELDNRAVLMDMQDALARGRAQGETGRLFTGSLELGKLEEAISLATRLGCKTKEARKMMFSAKVVLRLRHALLSGNYDDAQMTLDAVRGKRMAKVALSEIRTVQDEVDNWTIVSDVSARLSEGRATGSVGQLDISTIRTEELRTSIARAEELGLKTIEAQALVVGGKLVLDVRYALLEGDWTKVETTLAAAASAKPLAELAAAELAVVSDELDNRKVVRVLSDSLLDGAASGRPGELDLSSVDTVHLDRAVSTAARLGCKTAKAEELLTACKIIRRLRATLLARNWEWVNSVLEEARANRAVFSEASLRELQLAQDELDNRSVLSRLAAALRSGAAMGEVGALDLDSTDTVAIDDAVAHAEALGCRTIEASQMLATARLVRRLRQGLLTGDMQKCLELLEGVRGKVLAAVAAEEVQSIKHEVDNWTVVTELTAAMQTGAGSATVVGDMDLSVIDTTALDEAIPLTMRLGCHTEEAKRCLETALILRRLRQALVDADWRLLKETVMEADATSGGLVTCARREVSAARDELELRDVLSELHSMAEALDEAGLSAALSRSARLGLATHPRSEVRSPVEAAQSALTKLQRCKASLGAARRAMSAAQLVDALALAATVGYSGPLADKAREALQMVREATERATVALREVDTARMEASLSECERLGIALPLLSQIRQLLALPRDEYLHRQLAAAVREGDGARVAEITMEIKQSYFAEHGRLDQFALHLYPGLKPPHLFAGYSLSASRLEQRMMSWQGESTSTSLTRISDVTARRAAVRAFRCVQTFMGDRSGTKPIEGACDALARAVESSLRAQQAQTQLDEAAATGGTSTAAAAAAGGGESEDDKAAAGMLADEILLQVMKQLSRNPYPGSRIRGWVLLRLLLASAPPSEELEHFVEAFLRKCEITRRDSILPGAVPTLGAPEADMGGARVDGTGSVSEAVLAKHCLRAMHLTLFKGAASEAPDATTVMTTLKTARAPALPTITASVALRLGVITPSRSGAAAVAAIERSTDRVPCTWATLDKVEAGDFAAAAASAAASTPPTLHPEHQSSPAANAAAAAAAAALSGAPPNGTAANAAIVAAGVPNGTSSPPPPRGVFSAERMEERRPTAPQDDADRIREIAARAAASAASGARSDAAQGIDSRIQSSFASQDHHHTSPYAGAFAGGTMPSGVSSSSPPGVPLHPSSALRHSGSPPHPRGAGSVTFGSTTTQSIAPLSGRSLPPPPPPAKHPSSSSSVVSAPGDVTTGARHQGERVNAAPGWAASGPTAPRRAAAPNKIPVRDGAGGRGLTAVDVLAAPSTGPAMGMVAFGSLASGENKGKKLRRLDSVTEAMLEAAAAAKQRLRGEPAAGRHSPDPLGAQMAGFSRSLRPYA